MHFYKVTRMNRLIYGPSRLTEGARHGPPALPKSAPDDDCALHTMRPAIHPGITLTNFTHSVKARANGVKFAHQLLCNPKKLTLLKAVRKGFLKGRPNLSKKLILKYLNPSPTTAKGHMKQPCHGIKRTRPKQNRLWRAIRVLHTCRHLK